MAIEEVVDAGAHPTLQEQCAVACGWRRAVDPRLVGTDWWTNDDGLSFAHALPAYGADTAAGHALAVEMMQAHRIGVQPAGPHRGYSDAHWEAYITDASDPERVVSACGSIIPEAVARCFLAMREARQAAL